MERPLFIEQINSQFKVHSLCGILGPRQVGKTTLAHLYTQKQVDSPILFLDLENPFDLARLEHPMLTLNNPNQFVVIDEIQLRPNLFPILRVLVDKEKRQFLILGSASQDLIRQSSETLAGRIGYIELPPFALFETHAPSEKLLLRGGFPRSYLAENDEESFLWRQAYITTFLERDLQNFGFTNILPLQMRRFWMMLAHYHGQIFSGSEIARSLQISEYYVRKYLDILAGTFMIRILTPWFENISKRQVKSPKIYFRDTGILLALLGIQTKKELDVYPKLGAIWEGFALEEIIRIHQLRAEECFFWATQSGAELDLLIFQSGKRIGFEFKYTDHPKISSSMKIAIETLQLDKLYIVCPGKHDFPLTNTIFIKGLETWPQEI